MEEGSCSSVVPCCENNVTKKPVSQTHKSKKRPAKVRGEVGSGPPWLAQGADKKKSEGKKELCGGHRKCLSCAGYRGRVGIKTIHRLDKRRDPGPPKSMSRGEDGDSGGGKKRKGTRGLVLNCSEYPGRNKAGGGLDLSAG